MFDVCNNTSVPMLQESADIVTGGSRHNDMRINATKTKEMIICFCRNDNHVASIPRIVERVTQAKVLGVTFTADLSWNAHVDTIVSKTASENQFPNRDCQRGALRFEMVSCDAVASGC